MNQKKSLVFAAAVLLLLSGCQVKSVSRRPEPSSPQTATEAPVEETVAATIAPDGNPEDVTCKGTYTGEVRKDAVVARAGEAELTAGELQSWYWAAVAQHQQTRGLEELNYRGQLDTQTCSEADGVNSWQQYFLRQALDNWHAAQALYHQAQVTELTTEAAYAPNLKTHADCMTGMPATKYLYGYQKYYEPNSMHQAYLDGIPQMLEDIAQEKGYSDVNALSRAMGTDWNGLYSWAWFYNYGYTYLTFLSYDLSPTEEEVEKWYQDNLQKYAAEGLDRGSGDAVDVLQVLLVPDSRAEADQNACVDHARELLEHWRKKTRQTEQSFAVLAHDNSQDAGTAPSGGYYRSLRKGQLPEPVDAWCFDQQRQAGDTAIVTSQQGVHILYFSARTPLWQAVAKKDLTGELLRRQLADAKEALPMEVDYAAVTLGQGEPLLSFGDVLYPDVAHERYPEVPLYLQQDYPQTMYGNYKISSHGCGITTFSMLTTYMSDEEWTPPEMCELFGNYCFSNGTDGMLFVNEPARFHYFFRERVFEPGAAKAALEDGYLVVSVQHKGYWTRAAHYILLEKLTEDGYVQVRDSNIANYKRLPQHAEDKHDWWNTNYASDGYWVFDKKVTRIGACSRCGDPDTWQLVTGYLCEKCEKALIRRNAYLTET